jgi:hypothetical protein
VFHPRPRSGVGGLDVLLKMKRSHKRRLNLLTKERNRRIQRLLEKGLISNACEIPDNAVPVDPDRSTKSLGWSPELFYQDIEFSCTDCGKSECWAAEAQQHYFEEMRASPYKQPKRCYDCRQKENLRRDKARMDAGHGKHQAEHGEGGKASPATS